MKYSSLHRVRRLKMRRYFNVMNRGTVLGVDLL